MSADANANANAVAYAICSKCGEQRVRGKKCRPCEADRKANYYRSNKAHVQAKSTAWRQNNSERRKATNAAWWAANTDHLKAYRTTHRARDAAANAKWREANSEWLKPYMSAVNMAYREVNAVRLQAQRAKFRQLNAARLSEAHARWRAANPEQVEAYRNARKPARALYEAATREHKRAVDKKHRVANKERLAAKNAAWYEANKDRVRLTGAAWREANQEKLCAKDHRRRARLRNAAGSWTPAEWEAKKKAHAYRCAGFINPCGLREGDHLSDGTLMALTRGHAVPLAAGGSNMIANLIPQCLPCNLKQGVNIHPSVRMMTFFDVAS